MLGNGCGAVWCPIVIGLGVDETVVASDAAAIMPHTRDVIYLEDFDLAVISGSGVNMLDIQHTPVNRKVTLMDWEAEEAEKGDFDHFMVKEIFEQPTAIKNAIRGRLDFEMGTAILSGLDLSQRDAALINRVLVVGCGTSMHAGMVGEYAEELARYPQK